MEQDNPDRTAKFEVTRQNLSLKWAEDLASYISDHYSGLVVEIGVGFVSDVSSRLRGLKVVATDVEPRNLSGLKVVADDIFNPSIDLYRGANLLFSVRPPLEMQLAIGKLASVVGCDVLIRPLGDEIAELSGFSRKLQNYGNARFYIFYRRQRV